MQSLQIGVHNIMQLDELIEHAKFHKQEYGDNFFVFLSKHYGELKAEHHNKHKEEQKDHEELPFQCQGQVISIIAFIPQTAINNLDNTTLTVVNESNYYYLNLYASLLEEKLLQPPRQA